MKYTEVIKMPKGYYVRRVNGSHVEMTYVKTKKEADTLCKEWKA